MKTILRSAVAISLVSFLLPVAVFALTPEQVLQLKKAGVSEETIRLMIRQESEAAQSSPYDTIGRKEIRDEQGNTVVIYSTGRSSRSDKEEQEKKKVDNAWKMLNNMIIDGRSKSGSSAPTSSPASVANPSAP